uniref:Ribosomal protein L10a n=1 Tax=Amorphochlora amoebiformis TaxID=1561963 RepID=A0A0H5BKM9_9EUKA|nr:ribosomal protein L10a [Amorphochlora amoebiformis]
MNPFSDRKIDTCIEYVLNNKDNLKRKFIENIDIIFSIRKKNYKKQKKISGIIRLPNQPRFYNRICIIADNNHIIEAENLRLYFLSYEKLKLLRNNKKIRKKIGLLLKIAKKFHKFYASESIIKHIPKFFGPTLTKIGKFPTSINHNSSIENQILVLNRDLKIQFRKDINTGMTVGHIRMHPSLLKANVIAAIKFFIALMQKKYSNIKTVAIKRCMGKPQFIK